MAFLRSRVESTFAIADKHLTERPFVLGETPTIVDFSMAGYVYYPAAETGFDIAAANFRVIEGLRKKGVHDKPHGHPLPGVMYNVTDCKTKLYAADEKVLSENERKAGTPTASPGGRFTHRREHRQRGLQAGLLRDEVAKSAKTKGWSNCCYAPPPCHADEPNKSRL
jgi:hypothetical protein